MGVSFGLVLASGVYNAGPLKIKVPKQVYKGYSCLIIIIIFL